MHRYIQVFVIEIRAVLPVLNPKVDNAKVLLVSVGEALGSIKQEFEPELLECWAQFFASPQQHHHDLTFCSLFTLCLSLRNKELMLQQLQRLILNYPEEVTLELFPSQSTGEGEDDDDGEGRASRLAIQALEQFRKQHDARKSVMELSPGSFELKNQAWPGQCSLQRFMLHMFFCYLSLRWR